MIDGGSKKSPLMLDVSVVVFMIKYPKDNKYTLIDENGEYKLNETSCMSGPFSGPPSITLKKRIYGVTANPL